MNYLKRVSALKGIGLFKSISSGYLIFLLSNFIALFLTPFLLKYLTKEQYGFYILCVEVAAWGSVLSLGTPKVLGPLVTMGLSKGNTNRIQYLFNASFWFQLCISLMAIPVFFMLLDRNTPEFSGESSGRFFFITVIALTASLKLLSQQFDEMIKATKKIFISNRIKLILLILNTTLTVFSVLFFGINGLFFSMLLGGVVGVLLQYFKMQVLYPSISVSLHSFRLPYFKAIFAKGVLFTVAGLSGVAILKIDHFVLSKFWGLEMVASLYISLKLLVLSEKLIELFFNNFRPYVASWFVSVETDRIVEYYNIWNVFMVIFSTIVMSFVVLIDRYFVTLWVGDEFYIGNSIVFSYMLFYLTRLSMLPSRILLTSTLSKIGALTVGRLVHAILRVAILIFAVDFFGLHLLPLSNFLLLFFTGLLLQLVLVKRRFMSSRDWPWEMAVSLLLPLSLLLGFVKVDSLPFFLFGVVVVALLFLLTLFYAYRGKLIRLVQVLYKS